MHSFIKEDEVNLGQNGRVEPKLYISAGITHGRAIGQSPCKA
jgi:hypothetical protein